VTAVTHALGRQRGARRLHITPAAVRPSLAAVELASLPEQIRGFGHVKLDSVRKAKARWRELEAALHLAPAGERPRQAA
jgi:hypothetical protein